LEVKPFVIRREAGQETCGLTVLCDDDLVFTRLHQIPEEVVSEFGECNLFHSGSPFVVIENPILLRLFL